MLKYRKVDEHRVGWRSKNVPLSLLRAGSLVRSSKIQYIFVYTLLHIYTYEDEHSESKKLGCSNARSCRLSIISQLHTRAAMLGTNPLSHNVSSMFQSTRGDPERE